MNLGRLFLAAITGTAVYFAFGGVVFGALPLMRNEFAKYPAVYRSQESMRPLFGWGIASIFVAICVMTILYAMARQDGVAAGARFGALVGIFVVGVFVMH